MMRPKLHTPKRRSEIRSGILRSSLSIVMLMGFGCAQFPFPMRSNDPTPQKTLASQPDCNWLALTQTGRAAFADGNLALANQSYRAAAECTAGLSPRDARVRTSLSRLVGVAAAYQRDGNIDEASKTMADVHEFTAMLGLPDHVTAALNVRFGELSAAKPRYSRASLRTRRSSTPNNRGFDRMILRAADRFDVDPALVKAVVAAESNFNVHAISPVGAQGLMQLMPQTALEMGVRWPFDPRENLRGGVRYLRAMLDRFGSTKIALAAYNAGPEAVERHGGIPPYRETQKYVKRVLQFYANYRLEPPTAINWTDSGS